MVRNLLLLMCICFFSCEAVRTKTLGQDTPIPFDDTYFSKLREKRGSMPILKNIDFDAIYFKVLYIDYEGNISDKRNDEYFDDEVAITASRFYKNGNVNGFTIPKDSLIISKDAIKNLSDLNPEKKGLRGIYYQTDKGIFVDEISPIYFDGTIGLRTTRMVIKGDTIFEYHRLNNGKSGVGYIKMPLSEKNKSYIGNW